MLTHLGGHRVARTLQFAGKRGFDIIEKLVAEVENQNCQIRTNCLVDEILTKNHESSVIAEGVLYRNKIGEKRSVISRSGVVWATGGFAADLNFRMKYNPSLDERFQTTNKASTNGHNALDPIIKLGVGLRLMEHIQFLPATSPDEEGFGVGPGFALGCGKK